MLFRSVELIVNNCLKQISSLSVACSYAFYFGSLKLRRQSRQQKKKVAYLKAALNTNVMDYWIVGASSSEQP